MLGRRSNQPLRLLTKEGAALCVAAALVTSAAFAQAQTTPVSFFNFDTRVPSTWVPQEPSSTMRLLQMAVPGDAPEAAAELVVFFFGAGQGGDVAANLERWSAQFSSPSGAPVEPRVETFEVAGMPVTIAELTGTYRRGVGGRTAPPVANQTLLAAVIETERGSLFAQLHGPAATVAAQKAAFEAFVRGLRPTGP